MALNVADENRDAISPVTTAAVGESGTEVSVTYATRMPLVYSCEVSALGPRSSLYFSLFHSDAGPHRARFLTGFLFSSCSWERAGGGVSLLLPHGSRALWPLHDEDRPPGLAGQ